MKKLLNKLFNSKSQWEFQSAEFQEITESVKNPARGWYTIYPFLLEEEPDFEELFWCLAKEETLALVIINIGAYREKLLDDAALDRIRRILGFFEKHSYDVILRITYDHEGSAVEREPFFFKQVLEHLNQLVPVIKAFSQNVFVWQGMLIGNWGEMHTSRFLSSEKMKQLWGIMKNGVGDKMFLAVRRPSMWRMLHPEECGKEPLAVDSTGLFDDAIFGSDSHMGTFGRESRETTGWDSLWCREEELAFEEQLCRKVPNGGEAVCGETYAEVFTPAATLEVLKQMHITYLNQAYDEKILQVWKQWEWQNGSLYEYVGQHLGYRFCVRNVEVAPKRKNEGFRVSITIENTGFANFYQEAEMWLEQVDVSGNHVSVQIETDIRTWDSETEQVISCTVDKAEGELYVKIMRKSDNRTIYFANRSEQDGSVYLGAFTKL